MPRGLAVGAAALLGVLVVAEIVLQAASLFASDRSAATRLAGRRRILALGDSHTYGALVPVKESYPAHLHRLLDEVAPNTYAVVNLGIPGMNTSQVLARMPAAVERFQPELVVVWCGVNNAWNVTDSDIGPTDVGERLDWLVAWSRVYRLFRVVWASPSRGVLREQDIATDGRRQEARRIGEGEVVFQVEHGAGEEVIGHERRSGPFERTITEERAYADFVAMVEHLRRRDVPVLFVRYPLRVGGFGAANAALERLARDTGVTVVATGAAVARVPEERQEWLWGAHPNGPMYEQIAHELLPVVLEHLGDAGWTAADEGRAP